MHYDLVTLNIQGYLHFIPLTSKFLQIEALRKLLGAFTTSKKKEILVKKRFISKKALEIRKMRA